MVEFIEKSVRLDEAVKIFSIIEHVLKKEISTQVYVDISLFEELKHNGEKEHVYHANFLGSSHYGKDSNETWLNHTDGGSFDRTIHKASFVDNSTDHMQLVQFVSDKVVYAHFKQGFKQFLLIDLANQQ